MSDPPQDKNWKLKLRYGRLKTPYKHFTVIAEVVVGELPEGFSCPPGSAFVTMKAWAASADESADMLQVLGDQIGFQITSRIQIYDTDPSEPPRAHPHGYDISFTPFGA